MSKYDDKCLEQKTNKKKFVINSNDSSDKLKIFNSDELVCSIYKVENCLMPTNSKQCDKLLETLKNKYFIEFKTNSDFSKGIDQLDNTIETLAKNENVYAILACKAIGRARVSLKNKAERLDNKGIKFKLMPYKNPLNIN